VPVFTELFFIHFFTFPPPWLYAEIESITSPLNVLKCSDKIRAHVCICASGFHISSSPYPSILTAYPVHVPGITWHNPRAPADDVAFGFHLLSVVITARIRSSGKLYIAAYFSMYFLYFFSCEASYLF
jgi:hypothetical protein